VSSSSTASSFSSALRMQHRSETEFKNRIQTVG
jgi:hypothetical protein